MTVVVCVENGELVVYTREDDPRPPLKRGNGVEGFGGRITADADPATLKGVLTTEPVVILDGAAYEERKGNYERLTRPGAGRRRWNGSMS